MALTLNSAAPRGVSKPYVNAPGANPSSAAAFTRAAQTFYPATYGGGTPAGPTSTPTGTSTSSAAPFDYQVYLANDPILKQALAGVNAGGIVNKGQLVAGQARALVQRGLVPPASSLPGVDSIDETTRQLAAQNTQAGTSTQAALTRAYQLAQQGSDASLAARGLLRSGAYGQHAAENLQGFNQAGYNADQQLTDYLQGLYSGYLQQQQALQGQAVTAGGDAQNRLVELIKAGLVSSPGGGGGTPSPAAPVPAAPAAPPTLIPGTNINFQNFVAAANRRNAL